jgi:hypothetical protein
MRTEASTPIKTSALQRAEQQLGDGVSTEVLPRVTRPSLSGMKQADKMRHFHSDGDGSGPAVLFFWRVSSWNVRWRDGSRQSISVAVRRRTRRRNTVGQ